MHLRTDTTEAQGPATGQRPGDVPPGDVPPGVAPVAPGAPAPGACCAGGATGGTGSGIALPRWQVKHPTRVTSAAVLPMPVEIVSLTRCVSCIMTRAVFLGCLSSDAKSFRPPR